MIQIGNLGNFFHAIWLDRIGASLKLENQCFIGEDNVIAVGKDLEADLEAVVALHPDIIVAGSHGCRVNCPDCCDKPAYRNRVVRGYCEYLTEVGNYCIAKLAGEKGTDDVCEKWFCADFCESTVDHFSGISPDVPEIGNNVISYTPQQKREFIAVAEAVQMGAGIGRIAPLASRWREVMLYKSAKEALLRNADKKAAALIEDDRFSEAEALMGSNPYFEALKQWEELYCRRKGLEL